VLPARHRLAAGRHFKDSIMKRYMIPVVAVLLVPVAAHAQMGGRMADLFAGADTDHDGRISRAEFVAARNAHFAQLDRNGDGVVSAADFPRAAHIPAVKAKIDAMVAAADFNHDGAVTRAEMTNAPTTMFDTADTDHNGYVDQAELAAFRAKAQTMSRGL
jgi:Ca2+-binding EF-hand superfamily protein